jgi:glutamate dehydrogenase/leucine dehydrogenase
MNLFEYKKQMWTKKKEPVLVKEVKLPNDCIGWLVIDTLGYGFAAGGIRIGKKVNLTEVKLLAHEMTLKRSFYNQPIGGAKAGICCQNRLKNKDREEIFTYFGNALKPFLANKIYFPGTDLGTNQNDIDQFFKGAGIVDSYGVKDNHDYIDSSYYTAVSVFSVLRSIADFKNIKLKNIRIGIQGLGKVGLKLLQLASENGMKLVAGSTQHGALYSEKGLDVIKIFDLAKKYGDEFVNYYGKEQKIELDEFFEKDMDIMCPCAGIYPINEGNTDKIRAKIIIPGCNVAATETIEKQLYEREIMYVPGFVCNAGGVLGYTLKRIGLDQKERSPFLSQGIKSKVDYLLRESIKHKTAASDIARKIANQNQEKFILESKARMNGKLSVLTVRLKNYGIAEVLRTIVWKLCTNKIIQPYYIRKYVVKKIAFKRLFRI